MKLGMIPFSLKLLQKNLKFQGLIFLLLQLFTNKNKCICLAEKSKYVRQIKLQIITEKFHNSKLLTERG